MPRCKPLLLQGFYLSIFVATTAGVKLLEPCVILVTGGKGMDDELKRKIQYEESKKKLTKMWEHEESPPKHEDIPPKKGTFSTPKPKKYATSKWKKIMELSEGRPLGRLMMVWTSGYCLWAVLVETGELLFSIAIWAVLGFGAGIAVMAPIIELIGGEGFKHTPLIWGPVLVYIILGNFSGWKIR